MDCAVFMTVIPDFATPVGKIVAQVVLICSELVMEHGAPYFRG